MIMEKIYYIYSIKNEINGKCYIGFTCDPEHRKDVHLKYYKHHPSRKSLYDAFDVHGVNNFAFNIIYCSKDYYYTLNVMEPFFIDEYCTYSKGYNDTKGGEDNTSRLWKDPEFVKNKSIQQSDYMKGRWNDPEYNKHMSKVLSESLNKYWEFNREEKSKTRSETIKKTWNNDLERKKKLSKKFQGKQNPSAIKVRLVSPDGDVYILNGELKKFCRDNNLPYSTFMSSILRGVEVTKGRAQGWLGERI